MLACRLNVVFHVKPEVFLQTTWDRVSRLELRVLLPMEVKMSKVSKIRLFIFPKYRLEGKLRSRLSIETTRPDVADSL